VNYIRTTKTRGYLKQILQKEDIDHFPPNERKKSAGFLKSAVCRFFKIRRKGRKKYTSCAVIEKWFGT